MSYSFIVMAKLGFPLAAWKQKLTEADKVEPEAAE